MEKYEKRIKYLDYVEYGTKIQNGGFLKTEKNGDTCRVQISVKGLYPTDTLAAELMLLCGAEKRKIDVIMLHYGKGDYSGIWNANNLAGSGITYEEWDGIEVLVSEHRKLVNRWEMPLHKKENPTVPIIESITAEYIKEEPVENELKKKVEIAAAEKVETVGEPQQMEAEIKEPGKTQFVDLYEDKWTQLEQYYKRIRPFGDGRTYLSLTPRDFIVLGGKYQKLVSNSFLLHGYYNYGHVVLGRQEESEGCKYYLGVPGIYHEREKQVAKMFGFTGFEGAVSPSNEGGFGYYMTAVEI